MDCVKSRMEQVYDLLKEIDRWNTLTDEVETLLNASDWHKAAGRLSDAQRSLAMLGHSSDYEAKQSVLVGLVSKFENVVLPLVQQCLEIKQVSMGGAPEKGDFDQARVFWTCFQRMEKQHVFLNAYLKCRKSIGQALWQSTVLAATEDDVFSETISTFYNELLIALNSEYSYCVRIFGQDDGNEQYQANCVFMRLVHETIGSLKPSLDTRLILLKGRSQAGASFMDDLVRVSHATELFVYWIEKLVELNQEDAAVANAQVTAGEMGDQRVPWGSIVLSPFGAYCADFKNLERSYLVAQLKQLLNLATAGGQGVGEYARQVAENVPKLTQVIVSMVDHVQFFTHGVGALDASQAILSGFEDVLRLLDEQLKRLCREYEKERSAPRPSVSSSNAAASAKDGSLDFMDELDQHVQDQEGDWSDFHSVLRMLTLIQEVNSLIQLASDKLCEMQSKSFAYEVPAVDDLANDEEVVSVRGTVASRAFLKLEFDAVLNQPLASTAQRIKLNLTRIGDSVQMTQYSMHHLLIQTTIQFLLQPLLAIPSMPVWTSEQDPGKMQTIKGFELPSFSLTPSNYIHRVGEALLMLPGQLEDHFAEVAGTANKQSGGESTGGGDFGWAPPMLDSIFDSLDKYYVTSFSGMAPANLPPFLGKLNSHDESKSQDLGQVMGDHMLSGTCLVTLSLILGRFLSLDKSSITKHGAKQIVTDIVYLLNTLSALGIVDEEGNADESDGADVDQSGVEALIRTRLWALEALKFVMEGACSKDRPAAASMFRKMVKIVREGQEVVVAELSGEDADLNGDEAKRLIARMSRVKEVYDTFVSSMSLIKL